MNKHNDQQKKENDDHPENDQAKISSQQDSYNDKKWIILPILVVSILAFGILIYFWSREKSHA